MSDVSPIGGNVDVSDAERQRLMDEKRRLKKLQRKAGIGKERRKKENEKRKKRKEGKERRQKSRASEEGEGEKQKSREPGDYDDMNQNQLPTGLQRARASQKAAAA